LAQLIYQIFLLAYEAGFRVVALFNNKAKAGVAGRKNIFDHISAELRQDVHLQKKESAELIWMHCASLGEFEQGRPVLETLRSKFPSYRIVLTFFSASGFEAMKNYKGADHIFYLPFDEKQMQQKWLKPSTLPLYCG
jgi:3-deoxy-D-manno-octulosonic-acid transferase